MKILFGMPSKDSWGGPIASEPPFVDALRAAGHDVETVTYVYGDRDKPTSFPARVVRVMRTGLRVRRAVRAGDFDLIHLNTSFDRKTLLRDSFCLLVMNPGRAKVFMKLHGSLAEHFFDARGLDRWLIDFIKKRVDGFGYLSGEELENFERLGFDRSCFFRVKNAITVPPTLTDIARVEKESGDVFELLFVSRFVPAKGLVATIEACDELRRRGMRFRLTCVGDGESRREAEDTVGRLGLGRVVTFTGYVPENEVTDLFLRSDIFVFPTAHPEGFPMVLFKAVALGLPTVTTRIRAAADYLSEPQNCLYCTSDPLSIADRVQELAADKGLRENMAAANLEYGRTLSPAKIADEFIEVFKILLGDKTSNA